MSKPPVILYPADEYEGDKTGTRDPYKVNIIRENLEKMTTDEYYFVQMKGDAGKAINLDETALKLLQSYYNGFITNDETGTEGLLDSLTGQQKDELYRKLWYGHVCEDIRTRLKETEKELTDSQIAYAARQYVYEGDYNCNCSYWTNIDNVIDKALEKCK